MNTQKHIESCRFFKETYPYVRILYGINKRAYLRILQERLRDYNHPVGVDTSITGAFGWWVPDVISWSLLSTLTKAGIEHVNETYI